MSGPERKRFPILNGGRVYIDWQLVADHAEQANRNHGQTVERLAERGGLSWCELHAVLHNKKWEKLDTNDAMIACRALEARYLSALQPAHRRPDPAQIRTDALREAAALIHRIADGYAAGGDNAIACGLYLTEGNVLALLATPLSPTDVDNSPAPDADTKGQDQ